MANYNSTSKIGRATSIDHSPLAKPNVQGFTLMLQELPWMTVLYRCGWVPNTVVPSIYALGDVTGEEELTPVAIKAGRTLSELSLERHDR